MNAITPIKPVHDEDQVHLFRSRLIGACAIVEDWATRILALDAPMTAGKFLLLSARLDEIEKRLDGEPKLFPHPQKVKSRLNAFRPYADLRSEIVHATFGMGHEAKNPVALFQNAREQHPLVSRRTVIRFDQMASIVDDAMKIARALNQFPVQQA